MNFLRTHRYSLQYALAALAGVCVPFITYAAGGTLANPLNPLFDSIPKFIEGALRAMVIVALPILTIFIVLSGFYFVAARGNEAKLTKARQNFMYVILGSILILGAWTISSLIASTLGQLTSGL